MSLRDQLLAKGLVSKKDARRVDQEQRAERRQKQGAKRPHREVEAEEAAARAAAEQAERERKLAEKRAREAAREERERQLRIRQIARGNAIRSRGPFRFHHRAADRLHVARMDVSERVAWKLRCGEAAIVSVDGDYVVVSSRAAQRIAEFEPGAVVHWVRETGGLAAPEECLLKPEWDISLAPHRVVTNG